MITIGVDTSTDLIGVAFHDGEDFIHVMEFTDVQEAIRWTARRIWDGSVDMAVMDNYHTGFTDLLIELCPISYAITAGLPYNATARAKHLALTQQRKSI